MGKLAQRLFFWLLMLSDTSKVALYSLVDNYPPVPFTENAFIVLWYFFLSTDNSPTLAFLNLLLFFPEHFFVTRHSKTKCSSYVLFPHMLLQNMIVFISLSKSFIFSVMNISLSQVIHSTIQCLLGNHMVLTFLSILFLLPLITFHFFFLIINP